MSDLWRPGMGDGNVWFLDSSYLDPVPAGADPVWQPEYDSFVSGRIMLAVLPGAVPPRGTSVRGFLVRARLP